jgi:hypothetical protein
MAVYRSVIVRFRMLLYLLKEGGIPHIYTFHKGLYYVGQLDNYK